MIREIVKDPLFLSQKSEPATRQDRQVMQDLLDTVRAHADHCVGMAANMIGVRKQILVAQIGKNYTILVNPSIVEHSKQSYETEESCLSLMGQRSVQRYKDSSEKSRYFETLKHRLFSMKWIISTEF